MGLHNEVRTIAKALCSGAATPRALTCYLMLEHGEFDQLVNLTIDPARYQSADILRKDLACTDFLRKYAGFELGVDLEEEARKAFWASEQQCARTNLRLLKFLYPLGDDETDERLWKFLSHVRKIIRKILGPCPQYFEGRFGPGATYADKGRRTTVPDKISSSPTFTAEAWPYLINWTGTAWARAQATLQKVPQCVRGNRFTSVPKDSTKNRGICIEPSINGFYQLGVGNEIRRCLKRAGIDLRRGQETHRQVACEASLTGAFATIDLSSASDTVCINLVKLLLPPSWCDVLLSLRSPFTLIEGEWVRLEKFSSMGNGFTFELETLIFLAIARALVPEHQWHQVWVYGDDIIVPTEYSKDVIAGLKFLGFSPNPRKTYVDGWFKESCGGDFFRGSPVRATYLKEEPNEPQHFISLANGLRALGLRDCPDNFGLSWTFRAWLRALDCIPSNIRSCRGPSELGDIVIHDVPEQWGVRVRNSVRYFRSYKPVQRYISWRKWHPEAAFASILYGAGTSRGVIPRGGVEAYKLGWVPRS